MFGRKLPEGLLELALFLVLLRGRLGRVRDLLQQRGISGRRPALKQVIGLVPDHRPKKRLCGMQIIDAASGEKTRKRLVNGILGQGRIRKNEQGETIELRPQGVVSLGDPVRALRVGCSQRALLLEDRAPMMARLSKKLNPRKWQARSVCRRPDASAGVGNASQFLFWSRLYPDANFNIGLRVADLAPRISKVRFRTFTKLTDEMVK